MLLLGFIALHLLGAAILSLFYLLLAPAAVLAPALGDGGRAAFRAWGTRLLGAVCSKLDLLVPARRRAADDAHVDRPRRARLVDALAARLGAVVGRLPSSATRCWALIARRAPRRERAPPLAATARSNSSVGGGHAPSCRGQVGCARSSRARGSGPAVERRRTRERIGRERARVSADEQVARSLEREHAAAVDRAAPGGGSAERAVRHARPAGTDTRHAGAGRGRWRCPPRHSPRSPRGAR